MVLWLVSTPDFFVSKCGECIPFSVTLVTGGVPGALGTENLAKETGLNVVGRFTDEARLCSLLSVRLASDSEPP
jgi:hypothetical protein